MPLDLAKVYFSTHGRIPICILRQSPHFKKLVPLYRACCVLQPCKVGRHVAAGAWGGPQKILLSPPRKKTSKTILVDITY